MHSRWIERRAAAFALGSTGILATAVLATNCAQIIGIDDLPPLPMDSPVPGSPDAATQVLPDASSHIIDARVDTTCSEGTIESVTGTTPIDTAPAGNDFSATCGGESSPDQMLLWTAPVTDYYVFDTFGSGFDTVLALFKECGGSELACSNNVGDLGQSEIVRKFRQGEQTLVLVDGTAGDNGQGVLNIRSVTCPEADLEGQPFPLQLTTLQSGDDFSSQCGGVGQEDRAFHWVAPADGLYYFHVTSESFVPTIALLDGPLCTARVIGCNPASDGPYGAEVVRFLRASEPVTVVVDGIDGAGLFELDIGIKTGEVCPESELVADTSFSDDFTERTLAPSCDFARRVGHDGGLYNVPDKVYSFTVPGVFEPCGGGCSVTVSATQGIVLYALEGNDCGGSEVACQIGQFDATEGATIATLNLNSLVEDTFYTIVVADQDLMFTGGFQIESSCWFYCPQWFGRD